MRALVSMAVWLVAIALEAARWFARVPDVPTDPLEAAFDRHANNTERSRT